MSAIETWDAGTAEARIRESGRVVAMFTADWCGFCRRFLPTFERVVAERDLPAALVDLSDAPDPQWDVYGVEIVPTVVVYEGGKETMRLDGASFVGIREEDFEALVARIPGNGTNA